MEDAKQKIIFEGKEDPNDIIVKILEDNNLQETLDDYLDKIDKNQEPWLDILYKAVENLVSGNITEKDLSLLIQQRLNITDKTAENILKEIKQKLLPIARVLTKDEIEEESSIVSEFVQKINRPIDVDKVLSQTKKENSPLPVEVPDKPPIVKKIRKKIIENAETKQNEPQKPQEIRKDDAYREPLE